MASVYPSIVAVCLSPRILLCECFDTIAISALSSVGRRYKSSSVLTWGVRPRVDRSVSVLSGLSSSEFTAMDFLKALNVMLSGLRSKVLIPRRHNRLECHSIMMCSLVHQLSSPRFDSEAGQECNLRLEPSPTNGHMQACSDRD